MAFRSLSWMNANPGACERGDSADAPRPKDTIAQTRELLLALPSCNNNVLDAEDAKKALEIINNILTQISPEKRRDFINGLSDQLPALFSDVILRMIYALK